MKKKRGRALQREKTKWNVAFTSDAAAASAWDDFVNPLKKTAEAKRANEMVLNLRAWAGRGRASVKPNSMHSPHGVRRASSSLELPVVTEDQVMELGVHDLEDRVNSDSESRPANP